MKAREKMKCLTEWYGESAVANTDEKPGGRK